MSDMKSKVEILLTVEPFESKYFDVDLLVNTVDQFIVGAKLCVAIDYCAGIIICHEYLCLPDPQMNILRQ